MLGECEITYEMMDEIMEGLRKKAYNEDMGIKVKYRRIFILVMWQLVISGFSINMFYLFLYVSREYPVILVSITARLVTIRNKNVNIWLTME